MYKKFYFHEGKLTTLIDRLTELATLKRSVIQMDDDGNTTNDDDYNALQFVRQLESDISDLQQSIAWGGKTRADQIERYFDDILAERNRTVARFATLIDDLKCKIQALSFLLDAVVHSPTHRAKQERAGIMDQALQVIAVELSSIDMDKERYWSDDHFDRHGGSWTYQRLLTDNHHLKSQVEILQEKLKEHEPEDQNGHHPTRNLDDWVKAAEDGSEIPF